MALDTTIGGTSSDSYGTLAEYQNYATSQGWTLAVADTANEVNLRRAAAYLDRKHRFVGMQQYQFQALAWPRLVGDLVNGWPINPDTIPADVKHAQFEVAFLLQGGLDPFATIEASTTAERIKIGPITLDEETMPTGRPRIVAVEGLLLPYLAAGPGQVRVVRG